jgi:2-hydroxychromene-2-carboxylate isomerase
MRECERRASAYGLPPIAWPDGWPGNYLFAMRVATFAKEIGKTVSFSLAAFRQAFAGGRDLSEPDNVMLAAAAAEMHPRAISAAVERDAIKQRLREATDRAGDLGVRGVPSLVIGGEVFWGDDRLEDALDAALRAGDR